MTTAIENPILTSWSISLPPPDVKICFSFVSSKLKMKNGLKRFYAYISRLKRRVQTALGFRTLVLASCMGIQSLSLSLSLERERERERERNYMHDCDNCACTISKHSFTCSRTWLTFNFYDSYFQCIMVHALLNIWLPILHQ